MVLLMAILYNDYVVWNIFTLSTKPHEIYNVKMNPKNVIAFPRRKQSNEGMHLYTI